VEAKLSRRVQFTPLKRRSGCHIVTRCDEFHCGSRRRVRFAKHRPAAAIKAMKQLMGFARYAMEQYFLKIYIEDTFI
jgi:hypothetical protein